MTRGLSNFFDNASLKNSYLICGVIYIGLNILGSYLVHMEAKVNLNMESIEIDPNHL